MAVNILARLAAVLRPKPPGLPSGNGPADPHRRHEFRASDGLEPVGGFLPGKVLSDSFIAPPRRCALCNRPEDDPIHTPAD